MFFSIHLWGTTGSPTLGNGENANFLILGMDEVGVNTDVILLVGYQSESDSITVMQLPRDTYFEMQGKALRLNQVYALYLQTETPVVALEKTIALLSRALHIPIAGAVSLGLDTFADLVDAVGGVPMNIPFDMSYRDEEQNLTIALPQGETVLNGETAKQFVRFRSSYLQGDIGRLDAQKLFMASLFRQVTEHIAPGDLFSLYMKHRESLHSTIDYKNATKTVADLSKSLKSCNVAFLSIPGEAINMKELGWRYAINKSATREILNTYFGVDRILPSDFDSEGAFCADGCDEFENVYYADHYEYQLYSLNDISNIKILKKE